MQHEQIWAPWRLAYIQQDAAQPVAREYAFAPGADPECFICRAVAACGAVTERADRELLAVELGRHAIVILNRFPYNNGHLLIAPATHLARLDELSEAEHAEIQQTLARYVGLLERLMAAQGFNIGLNLGRVAGAGLPGHLHWHIVPRWSGDTNFMGVLAGVEVIPQSLDALWQLLRDNLEPAGR